MTTQETFSLRAQDARVGDCIKRFGRWWVIHHISERIHRYDGPDRVLWAVRAEDGEQRTFTTSLHETWLAVR